MSQNLKTRRIYKRSMAEWLVDSGCPIIQTVTDVARPYYLNWLFEDNEKTRAAMTAYTEHLKETRGE